MPITVYLDTQDYSRFGDVVRGRSSEEFEKIFEELKKRKAEGKAQFVYSVPILSELLQYDSEFEDTCTAKAVAVEQLCGDMALAFPGRIIEDQAADFAVANGILSERRPFEPVRSGNEWYPRITSELSSFKVLMRTRLGEAIEQLGPLPRSVRRRLNRRATNSRLIEAVRAAIPEFTAKYQLPASAIENSIVPLILNKITPDQASFRLFGAVAQPTSFIHVYFKAYEGDRTIVPTWMRSAGEKLQEVFERFRDRAGPLLTNNDRADYFKRIVARDIGKLGTIILRIIDTQEAELGINESMLEKIATHPEAAHKIPCCEMMSTLLLGYIEQTVTVVGQGAKIEHSFGGDLMHALYIDCVDIWRSDRRFSELIRQKFPNRRSKLEPSLADLPGHIDRLYRERQDARDNQCPSRE